MKEILLSALQSSGNNYIKLFHDGFKLFGPFDEPFPVKKAELDKYLDSNKDRFKYLKKGNCYEISLHHDFIL